MFIEHIITVKKRIHKKLLNYYISYIEKSADNAAENNRWIKSSKKYEHICMIKQNKTPMRIYQKLRESLKKTENIRLENKTWVNLSVKNDHLAENSYEFVMSGNKEKAVDSFTFLINDLFTDKTVRAIWINSFINICNLFLEEKVDQPDYKKIESYLNNKYKKKIVVAGAGWSGSGAIYDYFKEFNNISPIKNEWRHLESPYGLNNLRFLEKDESFKYTALQYFGFTLFGFGKFNDFDSWKLTKRAKELTLSNNKIKYAEGISLFCNLLSYSFSVNKLNDNDFIILSDILLNSIADTNNAKQFSILLFDNIIHIPNISAIEITNDVYVFCSFRDPRSNYVALVNESPGYNDSVENFILQYKEIRENFEKEYSKIKKNKEKIVIVSFEKFILSEDYRNNLANKTGLDFNNQDKYRYFKPWESEKNIYNYKDFKNQKSIQMIKEELDVYCIDNNIK